MANDPVQATEPKVVRISPRDLLKMTLEERDKILEQQAILAEPLYRDDPDLTAFEAFGPDDLYGESSSSESW